MTGVYSQNSIYDLFLQKVLVSYYETSVISEDPPARPTGPCAITSCGCIDPNNHASVMEHLAGNTLTDMTIKCQERVYYANRAVVCPKSSFFDRAMNGYFKESTTGTIELPDDDPDILEYFLEFLYTGDYTDGVTKCGPCRVHLEELEEALAGWYTTSDDDTSSDSQESDEANGTDDDANSHQAESDKEHSDEETDWDWDRPYTPETIEDLTMWYEEFFDDDLNKYLALPKTHGSDSFVAMTLPLRLYVMAVKYDVVPLADLARKRFITAFVKHEGAYKANVVDELYQNTTSTADCLIREAVIKSLVDELYELRDLFFIFRPVMLKHGDFAAELLQGFFFTLYDSRARMRRLSGFGDSEFNKVFVG